MIQSASLTIVLLFGVVVSLLSLYGLTKPVDLIDKVINFWNKPAGMMAAVSIRVLLGLCLILAAAGSHFPTTFHVLGAITLLSAVIILLAGKSRVDALISWIRGISPVFIRLWLLFGVLFGLFLVYATV